MIIRELVTRFGFDVKTDVLTKLDKNVSSIAQKSLKMGTAITAALTAAVIPAAALDRELRQTLTLVDAQGEAFESAYSRMSEAAKRLSDELGINATKVASGFYQVLSSGAQEGTAGFEGLSRSGLILSKIARMDTGPAIELLNDTAGQLGYTLERTGEIADRVFVASRLGATTISQLAEASREATPVARQLGIAFEDQLSILAMWANRGTKGAQAGTAFRQVMGRLAKPTKEAAKALRDLTGKGTIFDEKGVAKPAFQILREMQAGLSKMSAEQQNAALKAIAGEEAFSRLGALLQADLSLLEKYRKELDNSSGALENANKMVDEGFTESLLKLWNALTNLAATIGEPLLRPLGGFVRLLTRGVVAMRDFMVQNKGVVDTLVQFTAVLGALLLAQGGASILNKMLKLLGVTKAFGNASLIAWAKFLLPLALASAAVVALYLAFDDFNKFLDGTHSTATAKLISKYETLGKVIQAIVSGVAHLQTATSGVVPKWYYDFQKQAEIAKGATEQEANRKAAMRSASLGATFGVENQYIPGGGVTVNEAPRTVNVTVNGSGGSPDDIADKVGKAVEMRMEKEYNDRVLMMKKFAPAR